MGLFSPLATGADDDWYANQPLYVLDMYCTVVSLGTTLLYHIAALQHAVLYSTVILKDTVHDMTHWGVTKEKKLLYLWKLAAIELFESPLLVPTWKGKTTMIQRTDMATFSGNSPEMSLHATTEFFVNRLSGNERKKLAATLRSLDGKTIKTGSTCSGTDVIVPVLSCTFAALSRMFNVARRGG